MDWRSEILDGVSEIRYNGCVPGGIVVFGEKAEAILTNKKGEILIAAAEYGNGRAVVFAHDCFVKHFVNERSENSILLSNIKRWLLKGNSNCSVIDLRDNNSDIMNQNSTLLQTPTIFTCSDLENSSVESVEILGRYVFSGAGLLCGVTPWGYMQVTGKEIADIPILGVLRQMGLTFTSGYYSTSDRLVVTENCAQYMKIDNLAREIMDGSFKEYFHGAALMLAHLPDEVYEEFRPALVAIMDSCDPESYAPCKGGSITTDLGKLRCKIVCHLLRRDAFAGKLTIAPFIDSFPGNFIEEPETIDTTLTFSSSRHRVFPTGCYLPAGIKMSVRIIEGVVDSSWALLIGSHSDELYNISDTELRRWPKIQLKKPIDVNSFEIASPFGGLIYIQSSPADLEKTLTLEICNIVPSPLFTYDKIDQWESSERYKQGLWCDLVGDRIMITLPSSSVRNLEDLSLPLQVWDSVVSAHIELRGCDPSNGRGQWVVTDEQPSCGYMHAGYPIVTHMDVADSSKVCWLV